MTAGAAAAAAAAGGARVLSSNPRTRSRFGMMRMTSSSSSSCSVRSFALSHHHHGGDQASTSSPSPTNLSAMSSKVNLSLQAPSCPVNMRLEKELMSAGGEGSGLPLEVRRLAGDFVDSEECSSVPQGWWKWWRYQGL